MSKGYFKYLTGNELKDTFPKLNYRSTLEVIKQQARSGYPLRTLGQSTDGPVTLAEEDRESHVHILGSPGEGKSKFLEMLLRQDIDAGYGACLLDPSDNGDTMYKVLKYAIRKGHQKIVLIDPHDIQGFNAVPTINPIHYKAPTAAVIGGLMDAMRVLWGTKDFADTPRIQKYLPAVIAAIHASQKTLADTKWFLERDYDYAVRRTEMLAALDSLNIHRKHLEAVFASKAAYVFEPFQSTINRLQPFTDPTIELILGSKESPMNFMDLVSQGYIILVNLDPEGLYGQEHQRLLGTIIINEITYAISRLRNSGWRGVYYLYIDEAGDYATGKLSYILDKKRKSGLRLTLSHQRFDQFADKDVSSAVYGGTKIKVLFNTASREDRDKMIRMLYGGDIQDRDASWVAGQLKKQHAIIKINKNPPVSTRIPDIPDVEMSGEELGDWKEQHYKSFPHYRSTEFVRAEIEYRFAIRNSPRRETTTSSHHAPNQPDPTATTGQQNAKPDRGEDKASPKRKSVFDSVPDSPPVLQPKKGRPARKQTPKTT